MHRSGKAPHVHQDQNGGAALHHIGEFWIGSQAAYVIDNFRPRFQTRLGHDNFLCIERDRDSQFALQPLEYRQDTGNLFVCADGVGSRARRFSSYVENVRARPLHLKRLLDRQLHIGIAASGVEAVWRHVEDSHDHSALAQPKRTRRQTQRVSLAREHRRSS